ncbi:hypothetical protein LTR70_008673 [Exophiala xenobiotica]|uniref:Arrestin-like N-terminal domain-containing protein n=1 Tax=Lithohypha guttulata TaxID=1690604 RepID=A0ABR0K561_9EURO|nr:hypothetical protein LTR24_007237 [Lithohypha guttulata]KAK5311576.1 hypothetical protein LTR70_008673 [Exophiala xenobiotica]
MSVRVQLDRQHGDIYTNLDFVAGRVILTLPTDATISAITVKLEGESKSRLDGPKSPQDQERRKTLLEVHKLLYKVETVFPSAEIRETNATGRTAQFTLLRGQYEYPFRFKIPFNNDCVNNTSLIKDLKIGALNVQFGQEPLHAKLPLPPSLGGYPGEAEIKYFVKATVVRPKFYQENLRTEVPLTFLPIEQPRPSDGDGETYGRRKHQFQRVDSGITIKSKTLFRKDSNSPAEEEPLAFQVDARLPNPAIITCREPIPLRILLERLNSSTSSIYLSMLQLELIGHTEIRAHDLHRKESGTWLLVSQANMAVPLEQPSSKTNSWTIPSSFWDNIPLPTTVAPSFRTCNMSRKYELEVRVGLTHGMADGIRPEIIVSPIRLDVEVWSGIRPPSQLLDAIAQAQPDHGQQLHRVTGLNGTQHPDSKQGGHSNNGSPQQDAPPVFASQSGSSGQAYAGHVGRPSSMGNTGDDLPPSYEDAIASDLAPADGPRPSGYRADGTSVQQAPAFNPDSKSSLGRRVSERLFASNAPKSPRSSQSSRVVSTPGDLSRLGNGVVHEEPDDIGHNTSSMQRLSLGAQTQSDGQAEDYRPPLPMRRTGEQKIDSGQKQKEI